MTIFFRSGFSAIAATISFEDNISPVPKFNHNKNTKSTEFFKLQNFNFYKLCKWLFVWYIIPCNYYIVSGIKNFTAWTISAEKEMNNFFKSLLEKIKEFDTTLIDYSKKTEGSAQIPYLAYANWGISLSLTEDLDEAIDKLETSASLQPNSPLVHMNLGRVYMKKGLYQEAIERFNKVLRLERSNSTAFSLIAACYTLQDEFKDGENYYKKACKVGVNNPQIHTNYATALAQKGKRFKAVEIYKAALKIDPNDFEALHYMGIVLCDLGHFEDAVETLEKAIKVENKNPVTYFYLSLASIRLDKSKEALALVEKALELKPDYADCMMIKGVALAKTGKEAECISCFSANEKGQENNPHYYTYWGISLQVFGRYAEAKERFLHSFELDRDNEYNLFYLAENYIKEGNSTPALQLYMKIVEKNNNNAVAHEKIGDILYRRGEYKNAINSYLSGIKVSRKHTHLYNKIAKCYYYLEDFNTSESYYVKSIDYNPDLIEAYTGYTNLLMLKGNTKEALRKIRAAYKKSPDAFDVIALYAQVLVKSEMYYDAIEKLDKLLVIDPKYYEAIFTKAEVLNSIKKPQEAIGVLQSLPKELHDTREFLYISTISYDNIAQQSPTQYNINKAIEFCNRLTDKYSTEYKMDDLLHRLTETLKTIKEE